MGLGLCDSAPLSLDTARTSRQPGTRGAVEATAMSQSTHSSNSLALDLTSLSLSMPTSEGCYEDLSGWHMGSIVYSS